MYLATNGPIHIFTVTNTQGGSTLTPTYVAKRPSANADWQVVTGVVKFPTKPAYTNAQARLISILALVILKVTPSLAIITKVQCSPCWSVKAFICGLSR